MRATVLLAAVTGSAAMAPAIMWCKYSRFDDFDGDGDEDHNDLDILWATWDLNGDGVMDADEYVRNKELKYGRFPIKFEAYVQGEMNSGNDLYPPGCTPDDDMMKILRETFDKKDVDGDGEWSREDIKTYHNQRVSKEGPSTYEKRKASFELELADMDANNDGVLDENDFLAVASKKRGHK